MKSGETLFDDDFLRKLEYLNLVSKQMVPGHLHGEHRSKKKTSSGIEFSDYREYVSGEDTKNVDWRTFLRLEKLLLRIFEEEADLPIYIFIDSSESMNCGNPLKFDEARKIAAAMCYVGLLNQDRVNLIGFNENADSRLSARRGKSQVWNTFHFLDGMTTNGSTSMVRAFKGFFSSRRRRGLVVVISDFLDPSGFERAFDMLRHYRQDLFAVHLYESDEKNPILPDEVMLKDSELGSVERVKITPGLMAAYRKTFENHAASLEGYCKKNGWGFVSTSTKTPFENLILQVFQQGRFLK
ncbi:uncharacterized protein METZ01_LOCUS179785 [marine metagenome]|uniref:DUF58 domain-containing protein n=1 Tax=marine metagenome TaxID=408172 RepID=A0A382CMQ0_9ZZZZ|tara:strand:- start:132 stop:1022 length:891 start_codon:yes stop_codon:yes gene_type:complete